MYESFDFRSVIDQLADFVAIVDIEGSIRYVSAAVGRVLGREPGGMAGADFRDVVHSDDRPKFDAMLAELAVGGEAHSAMRCLHRDGSTCMLEIAGRDALHDAAAHGFILSTRDVTARERQRAVLEASERHYRNLVEDAADGIVLVDRDGRYVEANEAACRMLRYTREELLELSLRDIIARDDLDRTPLRFEALRENHALIFDRRSKRGDGSDAVIEVSAKLHPSGGIQAIYRDVSASRKLERELAANEQRLQLAARLVNMAVFSQDAELRYTWILRPQLGYQAEDVVGHTDTQLLPPAGAERVMAIKRRVIETGIPVREEVAIGGGGETLHFELAVDPMRDESGAVVGLVGASLDITDRKRAQQARLDQLKLIEAVFSHSLSCLAILDRGYNFVRVNQAYADACRRDMADFPGRNRFDLYPSDTKAIFDDVVRRKRPFATSSREFTFPDQPERGPTYWDWTLVPVLDQHGEVEYLVFSLNDVTDRTLAERRALDAKRQLQTLSTRLLQVQEEERSRISRELHAEIGQALTAVKLQLQDLRRSGHPRAAELDQCIEIAGATLDQVRDLSLNLRPPHLDHLGLVETLKWMLQQQARATGWVTAFSADTLPLKLAPDVEIACFRIAQEALTNIARHAAAAHVEIRLRFADDRLQLFVRDDGVGFDANAVRLRPEDHGHLGVISMLERASLVGGSVDIAPGETGGTEVRASLPVRWSP